jgi:hypothetical protein
MMEMKSRDVFRPLPQDFPKQRQPEISLANREQDKPEDDWKDALMRAARYEHSIAGKGN